MIGWFGGLDLWPDLKHSWTYKPALANQTFEFISLDNIFVTFWIANNTCLNRSPYTWSMLKYSCRQPLSKTDAEFDLIVGFSEKFKSNTNEGWSIKMNVSSWAAHDITPAKWPTTDHHFKSHSQCSQITDKSIINQ